MVFFPIATIINLFEKINVQKKSILIISYKMLTYKYEKMLEISNSKYRLDPNTPLAKPFIQMDNLI